MLCFKNKVSSFLILTTLIIVFFSLFASSGAAQNDVVRRGTQRTVLKASNSSDLVLARERTRRKDPLENHSYYNGGWNISNEHYVYSVLYTGYPLFLTATLWFILFGLFLLLLCIYVCCCRRMHYGYPKFDYGFYLPFFFLALFSVTTVWGYCIVRDGQKMFYENTNSTLDFVLQQVDSTVENLQNVSGYLTTAKNVGVNYVFLPRQLLTNIDNVNGMIKTAANTLESATKNNTDDIFHYLDVVLRVVYVVALVIYVLVYLGVIVSFTGPNFLIYSLVFCNWIFISMSLFLSGIFIALHNATGDTCVAMHEWIDNPTAHTALDHIIPCVDPTTSQEARSQSREVTIQMVQFVNGIIANVSNRKFPPNYYNQSGQMVHLLCNPYNPDRTDKRTCPAGKIDLNNATQLKMAYVNYECCLTPSLYEEVSRAVNVSYGLHHYGPFLSDLVDCTFLRDTFTTIYDRHCPGLREVSQSVYTGLVMLSTGLSLTMIFWVPINQDVRRTCQVRSGIR